MATGRRQRLRFVGRLASRKLHDCAIKTGFLIVFLDDDVVEQPAVGTEHLRDGLTEQSEIVLLEPFEVESAGQLDGQFDQSILLFHAQGFQWRKPCPEALAADIVPNDLETVIPNRFRSLLHGEWEEKRGKKRSYTRVLNIDTGDQSFNRSMTLF